MAKTLNEIVYSVMEAVSGYYPTDDFRITPVYLESLAHSIRESLIRDELRQGLLSPEYYQVYHCLKIEQKEYICDGYGVYSGYVAKPPALMTGVGNASVIHLSVGNVVLSPIAPQVFFTQTKFAYGRDAFYTILDQIIYFKGITIPDKDGCIKIGRLIALFGKPTDLYDCDNVEVAYPVQSDYKLEVLMKRDILSVYGIRPDEVNNARDDSGGQVKQQKDEQPEG